jgi:hypothetical protein
VDEVENISQLIDPSPTTGSRRISMGLGVPQRSVWRKLSEQGLYPFHEERVKLLQAGDDDMQLQVFRWVKANRRLVRLIFFTNKATTFIRDGIKNTRNCHWLSQENPQATVEINFQHCFSANVRCRTVDNLLSGPAILEQHLTGRSYLEFLINIPLATRYIIYCQHDGAPPHYTRPGM